MAAESSTETVTYHILVRGPNGEEERCVITPEDNSSTLRQRISLSPKFTTYTSFHFEVENTKGGDDLILDGYTPFSEVPVIGEDSTLLVVPDLYNAKSIRYQIKYSVALLSNRVPLISQIVKLNNDDVPASLVDYASQMVDRAKQAEEKKEVEPLNLKERLNESLKQGDGAYKSVALSFDESIHGDDLEALSKLREAVAGDSKIAIKSLSLSSYNPPTASRLAMGDLIYLRVHTAENNIFHVTGNAAGFFANKSTDSVFNPEENSNYPTIYPTLPAVLCSISSGFKNWFLRYRQIARSSNLPSIMRSLPLMPNLIASSKGWFSDDMTHESGNLFDYADVIMDESLPIAQLKTKESARWLSEYNLIREMKTMDMKDSLVISKEQSFASAAMHACSKIVDEGLPSLFLNKDTEPCYIVDDIFITSVSAKGSDVISASDCNEEVNNTRFLNSLQLDGLFTGLTTVVDYKGRRFLAQSTVPGIMSMSALNMIMWGSVDEGATIYKDERVKKFIEKIAEEAHWSESKIRAQKPSETVEEPQEMTITEPPASSECLKNEEEGSFLGPVEGRIVRGTDNRLYAVDFLHVAPVDVLWKEAHSKLYPEEEVHVNVRRQLVIQWVMRLAMLKEQVKAAKETIEKVEKGETVEGVKTEDIPQLKEFVETTEKEISTMPSSFDVNAFTRFAVENESADSAVRQLCSLIPEVLVPRTASVVSGDDGFYADTENIAALIHSTGLNIRYLGAIASNVNEEAALELVEREMVARAAKHILRDLMSDDVLCSAGAFTATVFLNSVLGDTRKKEILLSGKGKKSKKVPSVVSQHILKKNVSCESVWNWIDEDVKHHFHYELKIWGKKPQTPTLRFRLLRRVCQQCGIRLQAQTYDLQESHVIRVENVVEFVPHVKFAGTPNVDQKCSELYQGVTSLVEAGQFPEAYELAKKCLIQVISAHSQLHPQCLVLLKVMSGILLNVNDMDMSVDCSRAALYCSDVINGSDSLESAKIHTELASLLYRNGAYYESIIHNLIAMTIYKMLYGEDSAHVKLVLLNVGMGYMKVEKREDALRCMNGVMTLKDAKSDAYLNACFYACVLNAVLKKHEASAECKKSLEEALADKEEVFRKTMMEALEKQLKEIH